MYFDRDSARHAFFNGKAANQLEALAVMSSNEGDASEFVSTLRQLATLTSLKEFVFFAIKKESPFLPTDRVVRYGTALEVIWANHTRFVWTNGEWRQTETSKHPSYLEPALLSYSVVNTDLPRALYA